MSNRPSKLITSAAFLGMIFFAFQHADDYETRLTIRTPASIQQSEDEMLHLKPEKSLHYTQKVRGPLQTRMEILGLAPTGAGDIFTLRATIETSESLENVEVRWSVPDGLEILKGPVSDNIRQLEPNKPVVYEISLKKLVPYNQRVHFAAISSLDGFRFASATQYNTLDQEQIDLDTKQLAERNLRQMEKDQEASRRSKMVQ